MTYTPNTDNEFGAAMISWADGDLDLNEVSANCLNEYASCAASLLSCSAYADDEDLQAFMNACLSALPGADAWFDTDEHTLLDDPIGDANITRVKRQCARDHANKGSLEIMREAVKEQRRFGDFGVHGYRFDREGYLESKFIPRCLPWTQIKVVKVERFTETRHQCVGYIEVEYSASGARAGYGVKSDGTPSLWID